MAEEVKNKNNCIFCAIANGSNPSAKIYEDDKIICVLDIFPASRGHILVIPKRHVVFSTQMEDSLSTQVFSFANKMAAMIFEAMNAEGTNILVANGVSAGQKVGHAVVHVIPRYKGDNVKIEFGGKQITQEELEDVMKKIAGKSQQSQKAEVPSKPAEIKKKEFLEESFAEEYGEEERLP